jgi:NADH-quinone oxidoreductase subunit H
MEWKRSFPLIMSILTLCTSLAIIVLNFIGPLLFSIQFWEIIIKVAIFPGLMYIAVFAIIIIWFERKFLARIHLRIGPLHVGPVMGLLQPIADFLKLMGKEIIVPEKSHRLLYNLAPVAAVTVSCLAMAVVPFGPVAPSKNWVIYETPFNVLVILIIFTLRPVVVIAAGWASNNKYSLIGAVRAAFQLLAYEVPIVLGVAGVVMLNGSFDLVKIVEGQSKIWFGLVEPLGLIVFFIAVMAELGRRPFDLPVAEQEIVFGYATEYSGIQFMCFMMAEYVNLCVASLLLTGLFLGGWLGPAFLPPPAWFVLKSVIVCVLIIMGRAAWPRLRMDQLLHVGWSLLIPLALLQIMAILLLRIVSPGLPATLALRG